jgi:methionyl-tRNA formyltransferase
MSQFVQRLATRGALSANIVRHLHMPPLLGKIATPVLQMKRKDASVEGRFKEVSPDLIISAGFSRLLPDSILKAPRLGSFNFHPSPLPRYAGCDPWFWMLRNGERVSGVTAHRMVADADAGSIVDQQIFPIGSSWNYRALSNYSAWRSALMLRHCLSCWATGDFSESAQDLSQRSFFSAPKEEDYKIDWTASAKQITDLVRAASPSRGAWTIFPPAERVVIHAVKAGPKSGNDSPGQLTKVAGGRISVTCGDGVLEIVSASVQGANIPGARLSNFLS